MLIDLAVNRDAKVPSDAITLAWEQLRLLKQRIATALPTAPGEYGRAHLTAALDRIQRAMDARPVAQP